MALIPCPECTRQISTAATACPQCGFPLSAMPSSAAAPSAASPSHALAAIEPRPAPENEEILWQARPSAWLLLGRFVRTVLFVVLLIVLDWLAFNFVLPSLPDPPRIPMELRVALPALFGAIGLGRLIEAWVRLKSVGWRLSNQRLVVEAGVFSKTVDNIDVRTVDDTKLRQTVSGRLLGFGTVVVISKDQSHPILRLIGVEQPREVQELIRATAYEVSRNQLFMREA